MINESLSEPFKLECGVPQGSCLGTLLFTLYTSELFEIIKYHLPMIHCYADDSQVCISFGPNDSAEQLAVMRNMEDCIRGIRFWMLNNGLKFNDDKIEFLTIGTSQQPEKLDNVWVTQIFIPCQSREILVLGLILGCLWQHISQESVPLYFNTSIIFVGLERIFHSSQLRLLSMHS